MQGRNAPSQRFVQTPVLILPEIYYEVMRTMVALVVILHMLYTVAYVNVPLLWSFVTHQSAVLMEV